MHKKSPYFKLEHGLFPFNQIYFPEKINSKSIEQNWQH